MWSAIRLRVRYVVGVAGAACAQNATESVLSLATNCCGVSFPVMNAIESVWNTVVYHFESSRISAS